MPTGNPALSERTFLEAAEDRSDPSVMTLSGAVLKSCILTTLLVAAGGVSWMLTLSQVSDSVGPNGLYKILFGVGAPIAAFVVALITCFAPKASPVTAPIYAVLEGLFLGTVSAFFNGIYQGIVLEAALLTVGTLVSMLFMYSIRWIVVTDKLRTGIVAATGAVALAYLASFIIRLCGFSFPYIHDGSLISIGFSFVVVGIAAFNLVLDFDTIETGARSRAPKYMEWYSAFGLLVTLAWLYLELLRLLAKLRSND